MKLIGIIPDYEDEVDDAVVDTLADGNQEYEGDECGLVLSTPDGLKFQTSSPGDTLWMTEDGTLVLLGNDGETLPFEEY